MATDRYHTIAASVEAIYKEKGSKFLAFAMPVASQEEIRERIDALRKRYHDATHHCYAWRLGADGEPYRTCDDGEPSGTAGRPILGQMISRGVTQCLVMVVRYFGGTKLGIPGLTAAYKQAAADVLSGATLIERTVDAQLHLTFPYEATSEVMRIIRDERAEVLRQQFDTLCSLCVAVPLSSADGLRGKLTRIPGIGIE